jgi:hypothetical protein
MLLGAVFAAVASVSMTNPKAVALGLIVRCFALLGEYHMGADQIVLAQIGAHRRKYERNLSAMMALFSKQ